MIDYIKILKIIRNKAYTPIHPQTGSNMKNNNT